MKFFRHAAAGFIVAQCNSWRFIRPGGAAGRWRLGGRSGAAFPCRAAGLRWIVTVVLAGLGVIRSYGDVTYADILLNPSRYVGHQVVLRGTFYYKNTERRSFGLKQGDHEVEVFWEQLSSAKQSLVLNQKNFSGVAVTVMGTVQRFRDARNSYYIMASDVVFTGAAPGQATARQAGMVLYTDILLAPERYLNRVVTMKGAFDYRNTERESFELKQGDDTVEVFYEQLPEQKRALILRERSFSGGVTTVVGTVHRFSNAENSYYIMASDVVIVRTPSVARMPDAARSSEGRSGVVAASPIPVQPKTRPALPTTPVVRGRSGARAVADVERKDVYEVSRTTVLSVVCLIILLTTIWVGFDSQANRITSGKGPYSLQNGALVWVMACVLLWIIVFPYYLVRRSTVMRERGGSMPAPGSPARVPAAGPAPDSRGGVQDRPGPVGVADAGAKGGGGWYYAEHGKATGPMEEGYLHVLVKGGQLGARRTLVWRQGMDGWLFYDEAFMRKKGGPERRRIPADAPALPAPRTLAAAAGLPVQGPAPGGRGRLSEQAAMSAGPYQPAIGPGIGAPRASGSQVTPRKWLKVGWTAIRKMEAGIYLLSLLPFLVVIGLNYVPFMAQYGLAALLVLPASASSTYLMLKVIRGEKRGLSDVLVGFKRGVVTLFLLSVILDIPNRMGGFVRGVGGPEGLVYGIWLLPYLFMSVMFAFATPLIVDQGMGLWAAVGASTRAVAARFGGMLWFLTVLVLVAVSGVIAFGVGMIVTVVLAWAAWLVAYNDIFVTTRSVAEQQAVRREPAPAAVAEIIHPSFVKGACEHCGGHFEFSSLNRGQIIECPHCHEQTRLEENLGVAGEQARPRQKTLPVGIRLDGGSKATAAGAPANLGGK